MSSRARDLAATNVKGGQGQVAAGAAGHGWTWMEGAIMGRRGHVLTKGEARSHVKFVISLDHLMIITTNDADPFFLVVVFAV
jgi:hypothetical protein